MRSRVGVWEGERGISMQGVLPCSKEGMETEPCPALHVSWAHLAVNTDVHTGRWQRYVLQAHTFIYVFFYSLFMNYAVPWKKVLVHVLLFYMQSVFIIKRSHLQLRTYCGTSASSCCSIHYCHVWCACCLGCVNLVQSGSRSCRHKTRAVCRQMP